MVPKKNINCCSSAIVRSLKHYCLRDLKNITKFFKEFFHQELPNHPSLNAVINISNFFLACKFTYLPIEKLTTIPELETTRIPVKKTKAGINKLTKFEEANNNINLNDMA